MATKPARWPARSPWHASGSSSRHDSPTAEQVVESIRIANGDIFRAAIANPDQQGMGTTVTAIAVIADPYAGRAAPNIDLNDPSASDASDTSPADTTPGDVTPVVPAVPSEALILANVGDSRTYLFRHERLRRVTIDHSYVQELVSTGHITEAEARNHPRRNIITRALGIEPEVRVDWWTLPLIRGDRFLLCSDGLVDEVDDTDIASTLELESDPQVAAERLVEKANEAGGRDNITVVVVDVLEGDDPPDPTQELDLVPVWAQEGTDPTPAGTLELDADSAGHRASGGIGNRRRLRRTRRRRSETHTPQPSTCDCRLRGGCGCRGGIRGVLHVGPQRMVRHLQRRRSGNHLPRTDRRRVVDRTDRRVHHGPRP